MRGLRWFPLRNRLKRSLSTPTPIVIFFFFVAVFVFLFGFFLVLVGLLAKEHIGPRSGLAGIWGLAFVPVELLLEARLRIGSPLKSTHGNFEFSAAKCADSECRSGT